MIGYTKFLKGKNSTSASLREQHQKWVSPALRHCQPQDKGSELLSEDLLLFQQVAQQNVVQYKKCSIWGSIRRFEGILKLTC